MSYARRIMSNCNEEPSSPISPSDRWSICSKSSDSDHCPAQTVCSRNAISKNRLMEKFRKLHSKTKKRDSKPSTSLNSDESEESDNGKDASHSRNSSYSDSSDGEGKRVKGVDPQNTGWKREMKGHGKSPTHLKIVLKRSRKLLTSSSSESSKENSSGSDVPMRRKGRISGAIISDSESSSQNGVSELNDGSCGVAKSGRGYRGERSILSDTSGNSNSGSVSSGSNDGDSGSGKESGSKKGKEVYEVEAILGKKLVKTEEFEGYKYYVKWKNWPEEANTWEPEENLNNCPRVWRKFHKEFNRIYERGFKRGMELEKVCAVGILNGVTHYLVQWKTDLDFTRVDLGDEYEWISKDEMRANNPQALLSFYDAIGELKKYPEQNDYNNAKKIK